MWNTTVSIAFAVSMGFVAPPVLAVDTAPAPARQREIIDLLQQDCGSCHGLTLKGGLGPPLTPQALAHKSTDMLRTTILNGRAGTPMAPWGPFLSDAEVAWLIERLLRGVADAR